MSSRTFFLSFFFSRNKINIFPPPLPSPRPTPLILSKLKTKIETDETVRKFRETFLNANEIKNKIKT